MTVLAPTLEAFFTDRLMAQRRSSPHTIAAYRGHLSNGVKVANKSSANAG